jgi:hypothetical protein
VCSCYTEFVLKNVTITVPEEVAHWARKKAAEENTSVSKLVGKMLEEEMRRSADYWEAYRQWKEIMATAVGGSGASRFNRDETHERR